jgi:hypothetical protein
MRPHQWSFLAAPGSGPAPASTWSARVIGLCAACGVTRVLEVDDQRERRFDLSGDCRTAIERADDMRRAESGR